MSRSIWVLICGILGLLMLFCGLMVPAHLRAVDASIIERAGRNTPTVVEQGLALARVTQLGAAELLAKAARTERITGYPTIDEAVARVKAQTPELEFWGGPPPQFANVIRPAADDRATFVPIAVFAIRAEVREKLLDTLRNSPSPAVQEVLRFRVVTNTLIFPPSQSASGQALDAALAICGLLLQEERLTPGLADALVGSASAANHGNSAAFEEALMDLTSLGQRLNWAQLVAFIGRTSDLETLRLQSGFARRLDDRLPMLFAAVQLSGHPSAVTRYLRDFSQTGLNDIAQALRCGSGGLDELLQRNQRLYSSRVPGRWLVDYGLRRPEFALLFKWFCYFAAGFLLAAALHYARPAVSALERPLQVRGAHFAREFLFALGFLFFVLLLSEPFLAQESQKLELPFRLRLPTMGEALATGKTGVKSSLMNPGNQLTMLLFFVIQGLLYIACVLKLAEIRRQRVPPRMKLKLLENEDHLFDAGLYLGFLGTIVSFILYSLAHAQQFSLMVAYSSTSFGIIFVSFFKIFHLRPARRKLLMEAELENTQSPQTSAPHPANPVSVHL